MYSKPSPSQPRRSSAKPKPGPVPNARRPSYLQTTLREIREKRISVNAQNKGQGLIESRLLSPPDDILLNNDRPTLSLTKLDFELLREWDWKERQKRLESWGEDLGITRKHKYFKRPLPGDDDSSKKRASKGNKGKGKFAGTSGAILKKELEHLTGLRVYAPGEHISTASRRKKSILKSEHLPTISRKVSQPTSRVSSADSRRFFGSTTLQQQVRQQKFDNLMKEAEEALGAKKTFGKSWGAKHTATADHGRRGSRVSQQNIWADSSSASSTRRRHTHGSHHTHHHHHHHGGQAEGTTLLHPHGAPSTYSHPHPLHSRHRTDIEEEQPSTSYHSASSRKSTRVSSAVARGSSSPSTPSDSAGSIGINDLFRGLRRSLDDDNKSDEGKEEDATKDHHQEKYKRPDQPVEYQDTCFGGIKFVDRSAVKPMTKVNKDFEFYMTFDDTQLGLGMGRTQTLKVKFFKNTNTGVGHSKRVQARIAAEKAKKAQEKEHSDNEDEGKDGTAGAGPHHHESHAAHVLRNFNQLPETGLLDWTADSSKDRTQKLIEFEKALMKLPGISSTWNMAVDLASARASKDLEAVGRIQKRSQFTRPSRRIWYTPLPLTIKKYYRTNWKKIRFDIRKLMKDKQFWPKLWINFEESHPKKLYELIKAKLMVKNFDTYGFKRVFDWGRGIHPDYIDWIIEDIVPHPGQYYYHRHPHESAKDEEAIRRASIEEADIHLKDWFVKPPRYLPDTPLSPPFDQFDFCGYGNREKPYFLAFTLPREILHYYAPPSTIQKFFRNIPKPPYAFPGYTFKRWLNYPLEQKLPQYYPFPKRFMMWTRGKVGERMQCLSTNFYTDDPYIVKRDIAYSPYHDSHTRKYILRKDVLDRIWELGIINSKGEVKCSMAEFNKNRLYLREYEWLEEVLRRWDLQWNDRQQQNRLTKYTNYDDLDWEGRKKEWNMRLENCKRNNKIRDDEEKKKFLNIIEKTKRAMHEAEKRQVELRQRLIERARQKQKAQVRRRKTLHNLEAARKMNLQKRYDKKDRNAERHRKQHFLEKMAEKMEKQQKAWERHVEFHHQKVAHMKRIERELEYEFRMRVQQHKQKVRAQWADIPDAILRNKFYQSYTRSIALKYAHIWLEKVRERKRRLPDEHHLSTWTHQRHMESTVRYLRDTSGYVDMNTLFFTAFRQAIKDQKESEDQEERYLERPKTRRRESEEDEEISEEGDREDEEKNENEDNYLGSGENSDSDESENDEDNNEVMYDGYEADEEDGR